MINIIGAGPIGSYTAYLLAKAGENVRIFEEHSTIGSPVQCTGLVTSSINNIIKLEKNLILNKIKKARIYNGKNFFETGISDIVIDRRKFDQSLADKAIKAGCEIFLNHKFVGIKNKKLVIKNLKINKNKKIDFENDPLIGADGPNSLVRTFIDKKNKINHWVGVQARARLNTGGGIFEVCLDKSPGFFGWVVPENEGIVRIGLATRKDPNRNFQRLLESKGLKKKDIIELQGGLIPIYNQNLTVQKGNIYLVGDAAAHVKATTGGGIIPGLVAADCLAESVLNSKDYNKLLNRRLNLNLKAHLKLRNVLNNFSNSDANYLISLCNQKKIKKILGKTNRDHPIKLLLSLAVREPRFFFFLKNVLK
ncbi:NAD(P)/FAD-dependent oxidoreductase [Candidatus Woesearchaeota archaeon]|nr:NAD(P)/FAD-dependent oxidoreductase [Candidatus Woesearchaeota archaeon]